VKDLIGKHLTNVSITNILEESNIKAIQNNEIQHFLIKFPIPQQVCKKISVYLALDNKVVVDVEDGNTVADCSTHNFAVGNCQNAVCTIFCKRSETEILRSTTGVGDSRHLQHSPATCGASHTHRRGHGCQKRRKNGSLKQEMIPKPILSSCATAITIPACCGAIWISLRCWRYQTSPNKAVDLEAAATSTEDDLTYPRRS